MIASPAVSPAGDHKAHTNVRVVSNRTIRIGRRVPHLIGWRSTSASLTILLAFCGSRSSAKSSPTTTPPGTLTLANQVHSLTVSDANTSNRSMTSSLDFSSTRILTRTSPASVALIALTIRFVRI